MELDAALAQLKAATASVVDALREAELAGFSREQLVAVAEMAHRTSNSMAGTQTVAIAHLAAVEDNVDQHGAWVEQHRGLGHVSLDAPGLIAPVLGLSAQAASTLVDLAVHQVSRTPRLVGAMLAGDLDPWRARVVTTEVEIIPKDGSGPSDAGGHEMDVPRDSDGTGAPEAAGEAGDGDAEVSPEDTDPDDTDLEDTGADDTDLEDTGAEDTGADAADPEDMGADAAEFGPQDAAADLIDDLFGHYQDRGQGWHETAGPLRGRVRRMVARAHPDLIEKEAAEAREGRGLRRSPATVGTDHWAADLPVEVSLPMWQAVEALAHELKTADSSLKIDQARADALAQLVLQQADITIHLHGTVPDGSPTAPASPASASTSTPEGSGRAEARTCQQRKPAERRSAESEQTTAQAPQPKTAEPKTAEPKTAEPKTAEPKTAEPKTAEPKTAESAASSARASSAGARGGQMTEVGGLGSTQPTLLDLGRLAATRGVRLVPSTSLTCHPDTGAVIGGVVPASLAKLSRKDAARRSDKYVVPADMARLVRLRDGRCRFPNCMTPASKTDQDHVIAWPVGETTPTNLMCLCRRHHRVKQRRGWQARLDPDGVVHWIDPTGRTSTTYPINHLDRLDHLSAPPPTGSPTLTGGSTATSSGPDFEGDVSSGQTVANTNATFKEIVRAHLRELDKVSTMAEDHLWRNLELAHRGSTLGPPGFHQGTHELTLPWGRLADGTILEFVGHVHDVDSPPTYDDADSDDPPF